MPIPQMMEPSWEEMELVFGVSTAGGTNHAGGTEPVFVVLTAGLLEKLAVVVEATPHHETPNQDTRLKWAMMAGGIPDIEIGGLASLRI